MKSFKRILLLLFNVFAVYLFFISSTACETYYDHDDWLMLPNAQLYLKETDFNDQVDYLDKINPEHPAYDSWLVAGILPDEGDMGPNRVKQDTIEYHENKYFEYDPTEDDHKTPFYVDARTEDGYSTWNAPKYNLEVGDSTYYTNSSGDPVEWRTDFYYHLVGIKDLEYTSPPTHMHLCLDRWDDFDSYAPHKSWIVSEIVDPELPTVSLLNHTNWVHYSDNVYTFYKAKKLELNLGDRMTGEEISFFKDKQSAFASYTVLGDIVDNTRILISFLGSTYVQELFVVASDWNSITFETTYTDDAGEEHTGLITIIPNENEQ